MRRPALLVLLATPALVLLAGCRACSTQTNDAPAAPAPSASVTSTTSAEPPSARPMGTLVPGSWKKGHVPPVVPPATSSTSKP